MSVHGDLPKIRKSKTGVAEDIPAELAGEASRDISTTPPTQPSASATFKDAMNPVSTIVKSEVRLFPSLCGDSYGASTSVLYLAPPGYAVHCSAVN
jgi:hypothetical protein